MKTEVAKLALPRAVADGSVRLAASGAPRADDPAPVVPAPAVAAEAARAVAEAAEDIRQQLAQKGSELTIEFDDALGRTIFKLVDAQTGAVVRQIPSEEVIAIARALKDKISTGVLLRSDA